MFHLLASIIGCQCFNYGHAAHLDSLDFEFVHAFSIRKPFNRGLTWNLGSSDMRTVVNDHLLLFVFLSQEVFQIENHLFDIFCCLTPKRYAKEEIEQNIIEPAFKKITKHEFTNHWFKMIQSAKPVKAKVDGFHVLS